LSLFRRDESGRSRARRARCLRARMQPTSSVRVVPEELESRVLLSASPVERAPVLFALDLPIKTAMISTMAQPSFAIRQPSTAEGGFNNGIAESGTTGMVLARLRLPTDTDPPTLVLVSPALPDGDLPTSSAVVNDWSPPLNPDQVPPLLVIAGMGSSSNVGFATTSTANPEYGREVPVPLNGPGQVNLASSFEDAAAEYASFPGAPNWPGIADVKRVEVTGTLSPDQTTMTFDVPVDAQTESVGVNVQAMGGGSNATPVVGLMALVNPAGTTMAQIGPPSGPGASVLQGLTVQLRNATDGSHVLIQITTAEPLSGSAVSSSSGAESGNTVSPSPASNDDVPFVLDVQQQDAPTAVQVSGPLVQAPELVGTLVVAPTPQGGSSVSSSTSTASAEEDGESAPTAQSAVTTVASTTTALSAAPEPPSGSLDSFNVRVSTGPFASRSASPLGPSLASIDAEATQQVDRHERAMSQEIEGLEPVDGEQSTVWRSEDTDEESSSRPGNQPGSSGFAGPARSVVDVLGSGGFPMMVTSPGRGQQAQVSDLWATLPSFADSDSSASSSAQAAISLGEGPKTSAAASRSSSDSAKSPDYVKAACGLAFGLLMTSGPLFPDLIARLSRRSPKWLAALRARTGRATSPWRRRHPLGAISTWIRGLFVPL
jgi:hypothetical protein